MHQTTINTRHKGNLFSDIHARLRIIMHADSVTTCTCNPLLVHMSKGGGGGGKLTSIVQLSSLIPVTVPSAWAC